MKASKTSNAKVRVTRQLFSRQAALFFVAIFGFFGTYLLWRSQAATSFSIQIAKAGNNLTTNTNGPTVKKDMGAKGEFEVVYVKAPSGGQNHVFLTKQLNAGRYKVCLTGKPLTGDSNGKLVLGEKPYDGTQPTGQAFTTATTYASLACGTVTLPYFAPLYISAVVTSGEYNFSFATVTIENTVVPHESDARIPYDGTSAWNTPIPSNPTVHPDSAKFIAAVSDNNKPLSSDVDQYTIPVYIYYDSTPRVSVKLSGYFSAYDNGDNSRVGFGFAPTITGVPIPANAEAGAGTDGQIVLWDPISGTEWAFWRFGKDASGNYIATNGYRYHTTAGYFGRFADGKAGRGAGTTYFSGLVRRWELDKGRIDHALSFAYQYPSKEFVYPASKSDGLGVTGVDMPEGSRLQLNPALTDADFDRWGLGREAKIIARALQRYGMYAIDNSGSSKIYLEDRKTAGWGNSVHRDMLKNIPWSEFRVVTP